MRYGHTGSLSKNWLHRGGGGTSFLEHSVDWPDMPPMLYDDKWCKSGVNPALRAEGRENVF